MQTIWDLLARLEGVSNRSVFVYDRRGRQQEARSWAEVVRRGRVIGAAMLESGLRPGDYVFLQLPNSYPLIECFIGAISAGLLPCCLAPPRALGGISIFQERMRALKAQFPNSCLVARQEVGEAAGVEFILPPDVEDQQPEGAPAGQAVDPESHAFIQLTSGSTKHPKAVCISHRALVNNVRCICAAGEGSERDAVVTWLPFYHDMGLVGKLFCAVCLASNLHVMQPDTFVARPRIWLQLISSVQDPVISIAPNFAYQSCVDRIADDQMQGLDLSRWRLAGCGAERVRRETLDAFAERFAPVGFRRESYVPCYGMAETTLAVTFGSGGCVPSVDDGNVSCGSPIPETEVVIRGSGGEPLPEGEQGEITVNSSSLLSGYAGAEHPSPVRDGWLHTGDRGYLRAGELYVTGRYKDLIIVDGVNIDPDEIEMIGEAVVQGVGNRGGAFSVEVEGRERVVLVNECGPESEEVLREWGHEIEDRVARLFGFKLYDLLFVRRGGMGKTSSGKVQRAKLRGQYEAGELETLWRQEPRR